MSGLMPVCVFALPESQTFLVHVAGWFCSQSFLRELFSGCNGPASWSVGTHGYLLGPKSRCLLPVQKYFQKYLGHPQEISA